MSYCSVAAGHPWHGPYHDTEYGFAVTRDEELFERLVLELNQAGLSWLTVLKKRESFRKAFEGFDIGRVAAFTDADEQRLAADAGIIRNRRKIAAAVENARRLERMRQSGVSFADWIEDHHPQDAAGWVALFRKTFVFTGGEITTSFLMSIGYLPGAHDPDCPVFRAIAMLGPHWSRSGE